MARMFLLTFRVLILSSLKPPSPTGISKPPSPVLELAQPERCVPVHWATLRKGLLPHHESDFDSSAVSGHGGDVPGGKDPQSPAGLS
ncbi:hypothetical protein EDB81DRAFT_821051 [Dactylonectria macrodidyma]|uniref:Secreted protein n=1 Tax=Dactylonectria macrodidyma TaxID=307937 RepID=A0A9P9D8X5_9HYPO|nr:hypothetical protein EDB81DRAFT_821051 [Dactylonectria macrodidyma]